MRIAVVGSGIAGLGAAWLLDRAHEVHVFEREGRLGGHAWTVDVEEDEASLAMDVGFLVFNHRTYPNLVRLFETLGVRSIASDMSFALRCERCDLEFSGTGLRGLFAQRRNLARPSFWRLLADVLRFNAEGRRLAASADKAGGTLGEFLAARRYSHGFVHHYLLPMAAAIWSAPAAAVEEFSVDALLTFFANHGLLGVTTHLQWHTVAGGSRNYVEALSSGLSNRPRLADPVREVERDDSGVWVTSGAGRERFDRVVLAVHADQARELLSDMDEFEADVLSPWVFSSNRVVLHTDEGFLPRRRCAWAAWNYTVGDCRDTGAPVPVTYLINRLQGLESPHSYLVTLNPGREVRPDAVVRSFSFSHPVFDQASASLQSRIAEANGRRNTFFCGAWLGNGFHEDGLVSALQVSGRLGGRTL